MHLIDGKNSVKVPNNFEEMTKYSFDEKNVSIKKLKLQFPQITEREIDEFVDAMKKMKVFV